MYLNQILQIVNVILILLTVLLLFRYAKQTYLLRQATVEHNELILKPCLTAYSSINNINLKNIGNGSAINVSIDDIEVSSISIPELRFSNESMLLTIDINKNFVEPHEKLEFGFDGKSDNAGFNQFIKNKNVRYFGFPFFKYGVKEYKLRVHYENISHQPYISDITVNCEKRRIMLIKSNRTQQ